MGWKFLRKSSYLKTANTLSSSQPMLSTGGPLSRYGLPRGVVGYSFSPLSFTDFTLSSLTHSVVLSFRFVCFTGTLVPAFF